MEIFLCEKDHQTLEPLTCKGAWNSPLQTNYFSKEGKEGDNRGELKENIECWKSSRSVEKRRKVK